MQEIIVAILGVVAIVFLLRKFVFPSKKSKNCGPGCGCQ